MFTKPLFNIGDLVQLKSGGPEMTVNLLATPQIVCVWFDGDEQKAAPFHQDALKLADGNG